MRRVTVNIVSVALLIAGATLANAACSVDGDCVAATCCSANACVESSSAPDCTGTSCSFACVPDTMDCGAGSCGCNNGACEVNWNTPPPTPDPLACNVDNDCVAASCCHADSCIAASSAPDCTGASCTSSCDPGTMDCGQGSCGCVNNQCQVNWAPTPPPPPAPPGTCTVDSDCVASTCCHPDTCVLASSAPTCDGTMCTFDCQAGTMDCGAGSCGCNNGVCQVNWAAPTTSPPATPDPIACNVDGDCVAASCCHPDSCVASSAAPDCTGAICTAVYCPEGSMDCGRGSCGCNNGRCQVNWAPPATPAVPTPGQCSTDSDCVPDSCCGPTSCVLTSAQPNCDGVFCTADCPANSFNCGRGSCGCVNGQCQVNYQMGLFTGTSRRRMRAVIRITGTQFATILNDAVKRVRLETNLRKDLSIKFSVQIINVVINSLHVGSLVADYSIVEDDANPVTASDDSLIGTADSAASEGSWLTETGAGYAADTGSSETLGTDPQQSSVQCGCAAINLNVEYTSDAIPDATSGATAEISLDANTWEVVFKVVGVKSINNGHVIASAVNEQQSAVDAFTPYVMAVNQAVLWSRPDQCEPTSVDTPATSLKVATTFNREACTTTYEMRYSLINVNERDEQHCDLTDDNAGNIKVNCSIVLSSVRAYAETELIAFTHQRAAFAAEINLGTFLNNEVADILHATMAKCSVKNGPLYVVDCRVPGVWNFDQSAFSIAQSPAGWINGASCASNVVGSDAATAATFIRCNIENDAPIANVERALANISATPTGNPSNTLTFDVDFIVPRKVTTTASASLASFVQTIEMKDGKYYYGTADVATLEITVVDTARLSMTALELFNSATPAKQVYDIFPGTSDARFQTALNADATKFTIDFYPAAIREDSAFYRFGPHGINVSFTFSAARRVTGGGTGNVLVEGLNVEGTEATAAQSQGSAASSSSGTALMAGVAVGAAVLVAGLVGAAVVAVKRRSNAAEEQQKEQL